MVAAFLSPGKPISTATAVRPCLTFCCWDRVGRHQIQKVCPNENSMWFHCWYLYAREFIISACLLAVTLAKEMKPVEIPASSYGDHSHRHDFLGSWENISYKFASLLRPDWQKERTHSLLTHTALYSPIALYYFVNSSLIFYYYCYWRLWRGCNLLGGAHRAHWAAVQQPPATVSRTATGGRFSAKAGTGLLWETQSITSSKGSCWCRAPAFAFSELPEVSLHGAVFCCAKCPHWYKCLFTYSGWILSKQQREGFGNGIYIYLTPLSCQWQRASCTVISLASKPSSKASIDLPAWWAKRSEMPSWMLSLPNVLI